MGDLVHFMITHQGEIASQFGEHLWLTFVALAVAIAVGIPLGIAASRWEKSSTPILGGVGIIQTIPSIALLGFLLPLLGIGVMPAIVALFLYALLPIVRNTYSGINDVDQSVREAAVGMGMSDRQILTRIELPLAVPVLFAGIRTATVINVGVATLCALIGAGGLGEYIFRGIALNNVDMILAGALPAAFMALLFDGLLGLIERNIGKLLRPLLISFLGLLLILGTFSIYEARQGPRFTAGMPTEFMERGDGYPALKEHYAFDIPTVEMNQALMYRALRNGKVDVIAGYSTDGRIKAYNLRVLEDDKEFFPPYDCAPLLNQTTAERYPEVVKALKRLSGTISNEEMIRMNYRVDQQKEDPAEVARAFLESEGFNADGRQPGSGELLIGGKNFTEQFILAHLFEIMIESNTAVTAETQAGLAGTKIVLDALQTNEIQLYPEYTGTALYVHLKESSPVIDSLGNSPGRVFAHVKAKSAKALNLSWLPPLGFDNTYALMMREEQAERLGIRSITDLVNYVNQTTKE